MLSYITPPVAIGAYAAAGLAQSNPMKTGFIAMRLGLLIFVIPILFVYNPAFILYGSVIVILRTIAAAVLAVILIGSSIEGYLIGIGRLLAITRIICCISGIMLLNPHFTIQILGFGMIVVLIVSGIQRWGVSKVTINANDTLRHDI